MQTNMDSTESVATSCLTQKHILKNVGSEKSVGEKTNNIVCMYHAYILMSLVIQ